MKHPVSFWSLAGTRNSPGWGEHQTLQKGGKFFFFLSPSEAKELMQNLHPSMSTKFKMMISQALHILFLEDNMFLKITHAMFNILPTKYTSNFVET